MDFVIKQRGEVIKEVCYENKLKQPSKPKKENQAWMRKVNKK
ncbi:hypothetical protein ACG6P0_002451 [Enterococcus hirae]|nr:hypothetical protein [Enterococcus hirae]